VIQIPLWFLIMLIVTKVRGERVSAAWESSDAWLKRRNASPSKPVFMSTSTKPKIEDSISEPRTRLDKFMDIFGRGSSSGGSLKKVTVEEHNQALFSSFMSIKSGNTEVSSENEKTATVRAVKPPVVPNQGLPSVSSGMRSSIIGVRVPPPPPPPPTAPFEPVEPVPIEASTPAQNAVAPHHSQGFQNVDLNADVDLPPAPKLQQDQGIPPPPPMSSFHSAVTPSRPAHNRTPIRVDPPKFVSVSPPPPPPPSLPTVLVQPVTPHMMPPITNIIPPTPSLAETSMVGELPAMNVTGPPPLSRTPWDDTQSVNSSVLETTVTEGYNA